MAIIATNPIIAIRLMLLTKKGSVTTVCVTIDVIEATSRMPQIGVDRLDGEGEKVTFLDSVALASLRDITPSASITPIEGGKGVY